MAKNSVDGTKYVLDLAECHLARLEKSLAELKACTELTITVEYGRGEMNPRTGRRGDRPSVRVVLKASDSYKSEHSDYTFEGSTEYVLPDGTKGHKSFEEERKSQVWQVERAIKGVESDIAFFKTKIAEFVEQA